MPERQSRCEPRDKHQVFFLFGRVQEDASEFLRKNHAPCTELLDVPSCGWIDDIGICHKLDLS
jgi:hypothetical protein